MEKQMYKLVNYFDVWGNENDGWEVNNLCTEGKYEVKSFTDEALLELLIKDANFLLPHITLEDVIFDQSSFEMIEFSRVDNGKPLGRLEKIIA